MFSRACSFRFHRASIGRTRGNGGILTFSFSARQLCEVGGERAERGFPGTLSVRAKVEWDSDAILDNGKLEDLVRLALKRLNVSYLTILSRLVWFQRETLVCHERAKRTFANLLFWILKELILFRILVNYILFASNLIKKYLIFRKYFLIRLLQLDYIFFEIMSVFKNSILIIKVLRIYILYNIYVNSNTSKCIKIFESILTLKIAKFLKIYVTTIERPLNFKVT